jgi:uncharacterized protein YdhG (YjbR/CyaY superfamily)
VQHHRSGEAVDEVAAAADELVALGRSQQRRGDPHPPVLWRDDHGGQQIMDDAVRNYIDAIAPQHRPLFDRLHRLVLAARPDATVVLSYQMPTYKVGRRRLFLGVWQHGVSIYRFEHSGDAGFTARHPELKTGKGTIRLRPDDAAAAIADDEFRDLVRAILDG